MGRWLCGGLLLRDRNAEGMRYVMGRCSDGILGCWILVWWDMRWRREELCMA